MLGAALAGSAVGKLTKSEQVVENLTKVGVPLRLFPVLAALELAGALGLMLGLAIGPLGVVAAACVVAYFVGALIAHFVHRDKNFAPAAFFLVLSSITLGLHIATL